jgi:hypothetical protein
MKVDGSPAKPMQQEPKRGPSQTIVHVCLAPKADNQAGFSLSPVGANRVPSNLSPSQTAARVETFTIAVLPQTGQRHRKANGEAAAAGAQSQGACFIGGTLL